MQVERQFVEVRTRQVVIDLPESFVNRRVELIVLASDDELPPPVIRRQPHPAIAGKGRLIGDLVQPVVEEGDWDCLA